MIRDAFFTNVAINRLFTSFTLPYLHSHSLTSHSLTSDGEYYLKLKKGIRSKISGRE